MNGTSAQAHKQADLQLSDWPGANPVDESSSCGCDVNVSTLERVGSLMAGSIISVVGLSRAQRGRLPLVALGASLVYRGVTGKCQLYNALGVSTADESGQDEADQAVIPAKRGYKFEKVVTVNRPATELFQLWRKLENLPQFMKHLQSVEKTGDRTSHWVASGPMGRTVEWDAEITDERENEMIAWQSLPGGQVATAGSVHFKELGHKRGTEVAVSLKYDPPAGKLGAWIATLLGEGAEKQIADDLRNFKRFVETGETPTVEGQPSGRAATSQGSQS